MPNSNVVLQSGQYTTSASTYSFDNVGTDIGYTVAQDGTSTITSNGLVVAPTYMSINPALHDQFDRIEAKLDKILEYLGLDEITSNTTREKE